VFEALVAALKLAVNDHAARRRSEPPGETVAAGTCRAEAKQVDALRLTTFGARWAEP
jgi:hypothetical protein